MDGDKEFFKIGMLWNGMRVTEIAAEVGGKTIASADPIKDVGIGHVVIVSKTEIMNEGEESWDEVGEGHVGMVVSECAPKSGCHVSLLTPNNFEP